MHRCFRDTGNFETSALNEPQSTLNPTRQRYLTYDLLVWCMVLEAYTESALLLLISDKLPEIELCLWHVALFSVPSFLLVVEQNDVLLYDQPFSRYKVAENENFENVPN